MREATGPGMEPLPTAAHQLQPVIDRAANDPSRVVAAYRDGDRYVDVSAAEFHDRVRQFSLEPDAVIEWANAHRLADTRLADLTDNADLRKAIQAAVDDANRSVSRAESSRKFALLPANLTIEAGELTPTLKVRRRVVETHYAHLIDELYGGSSSDLSVRSPLHGASA